MRGREGGTVISVTDPQGTPRGSASAHAARRTARLAAFAVAMIPAAILSGCATAPSSSAAETATAVLEAVVARDADAIGSLVTMDEGDAARLESALALLETSGEQISSFEVREGTPWAEVDGRTVSTVEVGFEVADETHEGTLEVVLTETGASRTPLVDLDSLLGEIEVDAERSSAASAPVGLVPAVDGVEGGGTHPALPGLYTASSPYPLFEVRPAERFVVLPGSRTSVHLAETASVGQTVAGTRDVMAAAVGDYLVDCAYTSEEEACGRKAFAVKGARTAIEWEPGGHAPIADPVVAAVLPDGGLEISAYYSASLVSTTHDLSSWHGDPVVVEHGLNLRASVVVGPSGEPGEVVVEPVG